MTKITYIEASDTEHVVEVTPGLSVMEGAVKNGVPGILADCGGNCVCATCRVYVDERWREQMGAPQEMEQAMLDFQDDRHPGLRLSCQMKVTEAVDGLIVRMPKSQH